LSSRKSFLAAAASLSLLAAVPAPPEPSKTPSPKPTPAEKPPSSLASAFAERMREFDPQLTQKNLHDIAAGIDYNLGVGKSVNPKGRALKNWDEPLTVFEVPE
jgi:hypothetical protein